VRAEAAGAEGDAGFDAAVVAVAVAVGLAEGRAGVLDVLREVARAEPVPVREIARAVRIPVPIVAAVCNELRGRGLVERAQPVRLTERGRAEVGPAGPHPTGCPHCAGTGTEIPAELALFAAELAAIAEQAPAAKVELDQTHCTVQTKLRRVLLLDEAGALAGKRVLVLGDDDLTSLALRAYAGRTGRRADVTVLDVDPDLLGFLRGHGVDARAHDVREPLPAALAGGYDIVCTDPPYTLAGAELFLSRAAAALRPEVGAHVFFSFGARRPQETVAVQTIIAGMGLAIRAVLPGWNSYTGAGILAGTSTMWHLRTATPATPAITGSYDGPLYTADTRAAPARPYKCAGCRAVWPVGPGQRWARIADLRAAGCPDCGGTTFRPQALHSGRSR
jgi:N4-bis(aminopropyl)spermidine synthase